MLRAAASSLLRCATWSGAARQLAPAAAWAAFGSGAGARTLTAQVAPADPHTHHTDGGSSGEEELAEFREGVRTFAQDFVAPHAAEIDRLNGYPQGFEFWRTAGEWGLHGAPEGSLACQSTALGCGFVDWACHCLGTCWLLCSTLR